VDMQVLGIEAYMTFLDDFRKAPLSKGRLLSGMCNPRTPSDDPQHLKTALAQGRLPRPFRARE